MVFGWSLSQAVISTDVQVSFIWPIKNPSEITLACPGERINAYYTHYEYNIQYTYIIFYYIISYTVYIYYIILYTAQYINVYYIYKQT